MQDLSQTRSLVRRIQDFVTELKRLVAVWRRMDNVDAVRLRQLFEQNGLIRNSDFPQRLGERGHVKLSREPNQPELDTKIEYERHHTPHIWS